MRGLAGAVWVVGLLLGLGAGGCEDTPPAVDLHVVLDQGAADLARPGGDAGAAGEPDAGGPPDLAAAIGIHGVPCGAAICFNEANQYCHTGDWGESGSCEMVASPSAGYFACDGPEDCTSGACCLLGGASVCGAFGFCVVGRTVGEYMCHSDGECATVVASRCCPRGPSGTYRTCVDGLGPTDPCPVR